MNTKDIYPMPVETTEGSFVAWYSDKGLAGMDFPNARRPKRKLAVAASARLKGWHALTRKALLRALEGKTPGPLPPLDFRKGTAFQKSVWQVLADIPCGKTLSYGAVAKAIGKSAASRAVGRACGANPIPVLVPCHRILAANSKLGGFSGGLDWKRKLLAREGLSVQ